VNNTGVYKNEEINFYIVGNNLTTGEQGFVKTPGVFTPVQFSDNGPDGFADLCVALGSGGLQFALPANMSGRIYVSIGKKLRFKVVTGGNRPALQYPAGWVSTDPNFDVLHDFVEFTYNDAGIFANTTAVDQFSIPLDISTKGQSVKVSGTVKNGGRDRIFAQMKAQPGFERLVVGNNLRVIAPGHGLDAGLFSPNHFDQYIDTVWRKYEGTAFRANVDGKGAFTGRVAGGRFAFDRGAAAFNKPSTRDLLFCDGALITPNDGVTGPVGAILCASLNRSTILDTPDGAVRDASAFYRGPFVNHYARIMHENMADGRCYAFAYDDVADFASFHHEPKPELFVVRLTQFGQRV
jgi:hypothetical protein